jgi:hypothetical protein
MQFMSDALNGIFVFFARRFGHGPEHCRKACFRKSIFANFDCCMLASQNQYTWWKELAISSRHGSELQ